MPIPAAVPVSDGAPRGSHDSVTSPGASSLQLALCLLVTPRRTAPGCPPVRMRHPVWQLWHPLRGATGPAPRMGCFRNDVRCSAARPLPWATQGTPPVGSPTVSYVGHTWIPGPGAPPALAPDFHLAACDAAVKTPNDQTRARQTDPGAASSQGPSCPPCAIFYNSSALARMPQTMPRSSVIPVYRVPCSICHEQSPGVTAAFTPQGLQASPATRR